MDERGSTQGNEPTSAARGSGVLAGAFLIVGAGNYAFTLVTAHIIDQRQYGVLALAQSFLFFTAWFTSAGFPWTATRRLSGIDDMATRAAVLRGAMVGNLAVASLLALALVLLTVTGAFKLGGLSAMPVVLAAVTCSVSGISTVARGGLQGLFRFRTVAVANLIETAVKIVLGVGLAAAGWGATGAAAGILTGMVVATLYALWSLRSVPLLHTRGFGGVSLLLETIPLFVGTAGMALLTSVDLFAVKLLSPAAASNVNAALYQASVTLARIPYFFASAMTTAVFPHIARARDDAQAAALYVRKGILFIVTLLTPISLVMITEPRTALQVFLPASYADAAPALRTIAVGTTFLALATFLVGGLQASGRDRMPALLALGAVVVEVVLLAVAIPIGTSHGGAGELVGAGIAFDIAAVGVALTLLATAWWQFRWPLRIRGPVVFALACAAMVLTIKALPHEGRLSLIGSSIIATGVYALIAVGLGLLSRGDLRTLRAALPVRRRRQPAVA
ncbi:MAG TPA: oligosaccharide flippase family protein [Candidatus Dormibacteraeota bacterium]|nr:oligosaccharide flippase family protein [Candidatus Dormibacteraeota bacterium]